MKIFVDSREQLPLFTGKHVERKAMTEGDYMIPGLEDELVVERKTPNDLYGSITSGHKRFKKEIMRSSDRDFFIVVECTYKEFLSKKWCKFPWKLKVNSGTLAKIVYSMKRHSGVKFIWCDGRVDIKRKVKSLFDLYYLMKYSKTYFK